MTDCRLTHAVKWLSHDKWRGIKGEVKVINEYDALRCRRLIANIKRNQKLSSSYSVLHGHDLEMLTSTAPETCLHLVDQTHNQWAAKNKLFIKSHESAQNQNSVRDFFFYLASVSEKFCWPLLKMLFLSISFDFEHFYSLDELVTKQKIFSVKVIWGTCDIKMFFFFHLKILIFWTFSLFYSVECVHKTNKKEDCEELFSTVSFRREIKQENTDTLSPK